MTITPAQVAEIRELLAEAPALPWAYRPDEHDDWGWIRGGKKTAFGRAIVVKARTDKLLDLDNDERDRHRREKTDPYASVALLIVAAVNLLPDLLDSYEAALTEIVRLRNIANEDGLIDPELAALAGDPMPALKVSVAGDRRFNPDDGERRGT